MVACRPWLEPRLTCMPVTQVASIEAHVSQVHDPPPPLPSPTVSSAEATVMDPQQRLLLEAGYTSFAGAHLRRAALMYSGLGVYLGIMNVDHQLTDAASKSAFAATCRSSSIAAGRLSFTLGLNGACQSVDTACSSALVAMRAASSGIMLGDHSGALCASVSLILLPASSVCLPRSTSSST